jgi:hypothetical protein
MHTAFAIAYNLAFGLIACIYPFVSVFRGQRFVRTFFESWIAAFIFAAFFSIALPMLVAIFSTPVADEISFHWVPDGPFVFAIAFLGWIYPLLGVSLGYGCRYLWRRHCENHTPDA